MQRLAAEHQIRGDEAKVHDDHQGDHEDGAHGTELPAALDHLRHAELGALRGMQRHENAADQIPDENGEDRRNQGQLKPHRRERAGHDGQYHDIRAEPDREEIAGPPMPFVGRNRIDGVLLDTGSWVRHGGSSVQIPAALS